MIQKYTNNFDRLLMKRSFMLGVLFWGCSLAVNAQSEYEVGFARVSIEPDHSLFSLPLAGYGYPREGRFTLEWIKKGMGVGVTEMTGCAGRLYALNRNGRLLRRKSDKGGEEWTVVGKSSNSFCLLASSGKDLYAGDRGGNIWKGKPDNFPESWKKIGVLPGIQALTVINGCFYAVCGEKGLYEGKLKKDGLVWEKIGKAGQVVSLTADGNSLYALTEDGLLWQRRLGMNKPWLKIAWLNGATCSVRMKRIAVLEGRLYGLSEEEAIYIADHSSLHSLAVSAVAIRSGKETAVIVGIDLTGFDYSLGVAVKEEITRKRGIPAEAILINASHSHFAPVAQAFPTWGAHQQLPDSLYLNKFVKKGMVEAIEQALDHMEKSKLIFGRGKTAIGANRSLSGEDAVYDPALDILQIQGKNRKGLIFLTGCHPVFRNEGRSGYTISPNFPGYARNRIEEKTGTDMALFLQGCAGDINPRVWDPVETGVTLGDDVLQVLKEEGIPLSGKITYEMDSVLLPARVWSEEKIRQFREENSGQEGNVEAEKNVRWADMMLARYAAGTVPQYMPVYIQMINIGNWQLVGLSREAVTQYGIAIKALQPDKCISVLGYCNDVPSYLPNAIHIQAGTYEGYNSFFWNAQPCLFPENVFDVVMEKVQEKFKKNLN